MKRISLLIGFFLVLGGTAHAQWVDLSEGIDEADIKFVATDFKNPRTFFAASEKHLYKTTDDGKAWKRVMSLRGDENKINFIYLDPTQTQDIYVATNQGVRVSHEGGKDWDTLFGGFGEKSKQALCIAKRRAKPDEVFVGTAEGLFRVDQKSKEAEKVQGLPNEPVYSILTTDPEERMLIATEKAIYRNKADTNFWEQAFVNPEAKEGSEEVPLEQFGVEEVSTAPFFTSLAFLKSQDSFYAATRNGVLQAVGNDASWMPKNGQNLPDKKVNALAVSANSVYIATDHGVFQSDEKFLTLTSLASGLGSKEVNHITYNPAGDYLLAATKRGIYRYTYPELKLEPAGGRLLEKSMLVEQVLKLFQNEPSIREIQEAAIQYAEVHPSKIEEWRKAAARRAFLPTLSLNNNVSSHENIDIDRGGTNDPDKFISGPREGSSGWSAGLSWNLGDLVWNEDQTSIDTRSRLMVELRGDILNEVTHLYYERRRLQVQMALSSVKELPEEIDRQIRYEELTACLDALTGGFLSKHLQGPPRA